MRWEATAAGRGAGRRLRRPGLDTCRPGVAGAVIFAGRGTADHLRAAMQLLSADVTARTVYGHLGWRRIGEQWAYLHARRRHRPGWSG